VTGRHRGPKRKLRAGVACTAHFCNTYVCWYVAPPGECYYNTVMLQRVFFISECGIARFLCAMHVFVVRASSSSPRYLFAKFLLRPPLLS